MDKTLEMRVEELEQMLFLTKNVLSFDEASKFLNLSKSYLYKLTSGNLIPHYKPQGKMLFFERADLEAWLRQNPIKTQAQIEQEAQKYILSSNRPLKKSLGNFSASTGKAKSKKTFNISAIVAAALKNDEVLHYSAYLPDNKRKILYVDTEQSKYHCHKVMERIMRLAGLPTDKDREDFIFVVLREYTPDKRKQIIDYMLANMEGIGLVIIDGIRDLMYDINSPSESSDLINLLMRWSSEYNLHIHTVLHLNKGDDNTRGHIGTELNNKAETVLQITKSTQDVDISEVKAMHIRDKDFEPFAFRINETALPEVVKDYVFEQPKQNRNCPLTELTEQQHREALENGFGKDVVQGYPNVIAALKKGYASIGFERGRNILVDLNKFLVNKRMIIKEGKGYKFNSDFHY